MKNIEIAELLPNKENYTSGKAGAASIWTKEFNKGVIFKKQLIFGNSSSNLYLSKNFKNLNEINFFKSSYFYLKSFIKKLPKSIKVILIHNRPHFFTILKKKLPQIKFILVFHNDPNALRGSKSVEERKKILDSCDEIVFVSSYIKKKFYYNIDNYLPHKGHIIYPASNYYNHNFKKKLKKKKIIVFVGKLNSAKGYHLFGTAAINILKKYKDWKVIVAGNEKREFHNFNNERFKINNWLSHKQIINLYKKSSISVVPSTWQEPFGRTAMESSDLGNALITTSNGGLLETSFKPILVKNKYKEIQSKIEQLIENPSLLKKIQNFNYNNRKINFNYNLKKINNLKINLIKSNNFKINLIKNSRSNSILHISNFDEKNDYRLNNINIAKKISNGFIKENLNITNFSDRYFLKQNIFLNVDDKIINIVKNIKPNLIILGHTNLLKLNALKYIKDTFANIRIAFWYEDSVNINGPDYAKNKIFLEKYNDYIDQYFITTDKNNIHTSISKNKLNFLPIPCSAETENFKLYKTKNHKFDIFFAASHGVNRAILKKGKIDERYNFLKSLICKSNEITYNLFGFNNVQPIWGEHFIYELSKCKFGLNLSRGAPIKYYSSNRIATLVANGIPTLIDERTRFNDFFTSNEMIFYKNVNELLDKIYFYKKNEKKRIAIGANGKKKYFKIFNNQIIADYILTKTLGIKPKYDYIWDK